jgi:hypothetical protein
MDWEAALPAPDPAIALSTGQQFEQERFCRAIDQTTDLAALRGMCKQLLQAWQCQRAATHWVIRQQAAPRLDHLQLARESFPAPMAPWDDPLL